MASAIDTEHIGPLLVVLDEDCIGEAGAIGRDAGDVDQRDLTMTYRVGTPGAGSGPGCLVQHRWREHVRVVHIPVRGILTGGSGKFGIYVRSSERDLIEGGSSDASVQAVF